MDKTWLTVLIFFQAFCMLIGVIIFMMTPKPGKPQFVELALILGLGFLADAIGMSVHLLLHVNVNITSNLFNLVNLPLFLLLYKKNIPWKNVGKVTYALIISFMLFAFINFIFIQKPDGVNSYTTTLNSISLIIISLVYFYVLIQQLPTTSITRLPMFWVNASTLIFSAGTFSLSLSADYLIYVLHSDLIVFWMVFHTVGVISYVMIWVGLWLNRSAHMLQPQKTL